MSKPKSQSQQSNQINFSYSKAVKSNKAQVSIINIQANHNAITSKTPTSNEKLVPKVNKYSKQDTVKQTSKGSMAARSQSTGLGSTRLNSLAKKGPSNPPSGISDIFENSKQRNLQANKFKSIFPQGSIIHSSDNFASTKLKQEKPKAAPKVRVLDEVNSNFQKLKLGYNINCQTVSNTRRSSKEKRIDVSKTNQIKEKVIQKPEPIKSFMQAVLASKPKPIAKEGSLSKIFSSGIKGSLATVKSPIASGIKITNIQAVRSNTTTTTNSTNLASYYSSKPVSKDKYKRPIKEANLSIEDKNRATTTRPKDTAVKQSNFSKHQKPSFSNLRKLMEKDDAKDKKLPTPKQEAAVILRNMNIDNSSALETLFLKNSKAIEKITNLNTENEESELVYPAIERSQIDPYYLKSYMEVVETITKAFKSKNIYPETTINFYKYGRQLGRGAFGKVNLGVHIATGRVVAIKSFKLNDVEIASIRRRLHLETQLMKTLNHPNVLKMYETFETDKHLMIALEYISGGDLLSFLRKRIKVSEQIAKFIFKQLMDGLKYMHSQGIIHRDVKLDNILIDTDSTIKLCDLGVSKLIRPGEIMTEQCGTPAYIAPEIIQGENYSGFGADLWSSGVVLYSLLSGTMPFKANNMGDLQNLIVSANYPELKEVSKDAGELICALLEVDPKKRLTADQVLSHPFLKDTKKKLNLLIQSELAPIKRLVLDYRLANKDNITEHFTLKNLNTIDAMSKVNVNTRSHIMAPFGSIASIKEEQKQQTITSQLVKGVPTNNHYLKFNPLVYEANKQYENNHNDENDAGFLIYPNQQESFNLESSLYDDCKEQKQKKYSPIKPFKVEISKEMKQQQDQNKEICNYNESLIRQVEEIGYSRDYIITCLRNLECNYCTASYYLLMKQAE